MMLTPVLILMHSDDRAAVAKSRVESNLRVMVRDAGLAYPPRQLFLRAFKSERTLEIWGGSSQKGKLKLIKSYTVQAASGGPGPKRMEGDNQVPEGFYHVDRYNPQSLFHLSLGLNYPNASDRVFANPDRPDSDIFIHGNAVSIGCLAMGDSAIEEIYTLARAAKNLVYVLILPAKKNPDVKNAFWQQIYAIDAQFTKSKTLPKVGIDNDGNYHVQS